MMYYIVYLAGTSLMAPPLRVLVYQLLKARNQVHFMQSKLRMELPGLQAGLKGRKNLVPRPSKLSRPAPQQQIESFFAKSTTVERTNLATPSKTKRKRSEHNYFVLVI